MKRHAMTVNHVAAIVAFELMALAQAAGAQTNDAPRTFCRFVPERSDDFAWENDKVAFRAYGPALRRGAENGGVDCWLKRVDYPIIDKWYKEDKEGKPYHIDHGEGYDPYHVGSTLGCGGVGLWLDGELVTSETFVAWKVIKCEPEESVFQLDFAWDYEGHSYKETKLCSIKLGDRLFKSTATFWKDGELAVETPVAVGLTTHNGKATASEDISRGWIACWEDIDGSGLGTGVVMDSAIIEKYLLIKSNKADDSHALLITKTDSKGQVAFWAGYGWEKAGEIMDSEQWTAYLEAFATQKK